METIPALSIPLRTEDDGTIRVGNTRVLLDLVIQDFRDGATPETIVDRYPALDLSDVYLVVGYYLQNRAKVDAYIQNRQQDAEKLQAALQEQFPPEGIRARLLARQKSKHGS